MKLSSKLVLGLAAFAMLGSACTPNYNRKGHPLIHNGKKQNPQPPVTQVVYDNQTSEDKKVSQVVDKNRKPIPDVNWNTITEEQKQAQGLRKIEIRLGEMKLVQDGKEVSFDYVRFQIRIDGKVMVGNKTADIRLFGLIDAKTGEANLLPYGAKSEINFRGHAACLDRDKEKGTYLCKEYFVDIYTKGADGTLYKYQETYPKLKTPAARGELPDETLGALPDIPDESEDQPMTVTTEDEEGEEAPLDPQGFQGLQPSEAEDLFDINTPEEWNLPPKEAPAPAAKPTTKPAATKPAATKPAAPAKSAATKPAATKPVAPAKPAATKPAATKPVAPAKPAATKPVAPQKTDVTDEKMTVHAGEAAEDSGNKKDETDSNSSETSESSQTAAGHVDLKVPLDIAGTSQAVGLPAAGRLENASALNLNSKAYIIKYPAQKQYYGTRLLVEFLQRMGNLVLKYMPSYQMLIGDLSDKNGGRQIHGGKKEHSSHQSGLDADISYLTKAHVPAESIVGARGAFLASKLHVPEQWQLFKETVASGRVSKFFVNPSVKVGFCRYARQKGEYSDNKIALRHLMIEKGHITHFHIRLRCPSDSRRCMPDGPARAQAGNADAGC